MGILKVLRRFNYLLSSYVLNTYCVSDIVQNENICDVENKVPRPHGTNALEEVILRRS